MIVPSEAPMPTPTFVPRFKLEIVGLEGLGVKGLVCSAELEIKGNEVGKLEFAVFLGISADVETSTLGSTPVIEDEAIEDEAIDPQVGKGMESGLLVVSKVPLPVSCVLLAVL